ncbi:M48 family metallopeptidase [Lachnobacterium bovis]|uniref:M48 family metallopeptidase n=1 Tax=Lachnobacterium bovis TaxID=140626 RepID=UPI00068433DA|nr:SprT family zinc-dependent metalloprotease [Lachnobacterium bovis]
MKNVNPRSIVKKEDIALDNIIVHVQYKKIKNLYLKVDVNTCEVKVSAPHTISKKRLNEFLLDRREWINTTRQRVIDKQHKNNNFDKLGSEEEKKLREYLKFEIKNYIIKYEKLMGVKSTGFTIRKMKTRWGSCNIRTHHLNFNLALARVPRECVEYVVVHELTHLIEPSHNKNFWNLMEHYLPGAKNLRKRLNEYSAI